MSRPRSPAPPLFANRIDAWLAAQCRAENPAELPEKLTHMQLGRLNQALQRAACSRFYHKRLGSQDLVLQSLAELERLPFTLPEDLPGFEDFLCVPLGEIERMVTQQSSGTTGPPKRLAFTEHDLARTREFFANGMLMLVGAGESLAVLLPGGERPNGVASLLNQALHDAGVETLCPPSELLAPAAEENLAAWLLAAHPQAIVASPSQLAALMSFFPQHGPPQLDGILSSAEPLDFSLKRELSERWHCLVLDHYGLTECGYGCAVECPAHNGCHVRALDMIIEIVAMDGTAALAPGQTGEVVITTFHEAMPLIRYRTGDAASLLPGPCACGSPLARLGPVLGRIVRDNNNTPHIIRPKKGPGN